MSISFNLIQLQTFLRENGEKESDINRISSIFEECDTVDEQNHTGKDGKLSGLELEAFQTKGMAVLSGLNDVMEKFFGSIIQTQQKEMSETDKINDKQILVQKVQNIYNEARDELLNQLETNDMKYPDPKTGEMISAKNLIKYLQNLTFKPSDYGAAQAHKESGQIEINTTPSDGKNTLLSSQYNISKEEVMKVLLHEALHCAYEAPFNTQEEEMFVESNAIKLMAQMIKNSNGEIKDFNLYEEPVSQLAQNDEHLEEVLNEKFINRGYEHRIKNTNGDVNIEGHEIKGGNKVYINGEEVGCIGSSEGDFNIDETTPDNINLNGKINGKICMSPQKGSVPIVIKDDNDKPVFEAFLVAPNIQSNRFENAKGDSIELKDGYTISVDGKSYCIGRNGVELQALDGFRGQLAILKEGQAPELISSNMIFDDVQPNDDKQGEYENKPFKEFIVFDKEGSPIYKGKKYM